MNHNIRNYSICWGSFSTASVFYHPGPRGPFSKYLRFKLTLPFSWYDRFIYLGFEGIVNWNQVIVEVSKM